MEIRQKTRSKHKKSDSPLNSLNITTKICKKFKYRNVSYISQKNSKKIYIKSIS